MNVSETSVQPAYFNALDYSILILTLVASLAIGIYFGFFSKSLETTEDYLVGGHKMKIIPIAISLVSSQISAIAILALPAEIYSFGWQLLLVIPASLFVVITTNCISLPVFYSNNIENVYVYLEMRFGRATRKILTVLYVAISLFQLPMIIYIASLAYSEATKQDPRMVALVICYICVIYTMLGGIKAVVWTDVLQASVMMLSVVLVAFYGVHRTGGIEEVWTRAVEGGRIFPPIMSLDLTKRVTFWNTIASGFFTMISGVSFHQNCAQRLVSLPSLNNAKRAMIVFFIGAVFVMAFNCATGIIMYAFYHGCDPKKANIITKYDKLMPRFVQDVAGHIPGMSGVFISCVVSASLGSVSAGLHALSGVIYSDYVIPLKLFAHNDVNANRSMRVIIFLLGSFCAFGNIIFERFQSIYQVMSTINATSTSIKFSVFTIGMLYPWANQKGALSGMLIGSAVVISLVLNGQYHIAKGMLHYEILPTSIEKCSNETLAHITPSVWTQTKHQPDDGFALYKISFEWYSTIGVIVTWTSAVIISHLTGGQDLSKLNIQLLSPFVQKLIPIKYRHTELKTIENKIYVEKSNVSKTNSEQSELIASNKKNVVK